MAHVNVSFDHLYGSGCPPEEILQQVQALEAAGLQVNLQIRQPEGIQMLQQLPDVKRQRAPLHRLSLVSLLLIGTLAGGASILFGLSGFFLP